VAGLFRWPTTERRALGPAFDGHDRVVLVTEYLLDVPDVPADVPLYAWETRRFSRHEHPPRFEGGPRRGLFRSLGDPSFRVIPWVGGVGEIRRIRGLISYLATN
jgi:hypothetical protein